MLRAWFTIICVLSCLSAFTQCRPNSLFQNSSFEEQSCCPDGPGQFNCLDGWKWPHQLASPDYLHACGYDGILNNPPIYAYPTGYPDGQGAVNILYCDIASSNEMIQTCTAQPLNINRTYSFSAFVGFNKSNSQGSLMPTTLTLYGSIGSCNVLNSFPGAECPPASSWDLLAEIDYESALDQGWVFNQSDCFTPARPYNRFVVGTSCDLRTCGGCLVDLVELQFCEEILQLELEITAQTCDLPGKVNGGINLTVVGGTPPYRFDWDNDGVGDEDDPQNLEGIPSGSYEVIVRDNDGRANCLSVYVPEDLDTPVQTRFDAIDPICLGSSAPELRSFSANRPTVRGTWSPAVIDSSAVGTQNYVFTPNDEYCATPFTLAVTVLDTVGLTERVRSDHCSGSGYSLQVNGNTYDEQNPSGQEMLIAENGCDSMVMIDLEFIDEVRDTIEYSGCSGDGFTVDLNGNIYDELDPSGEETLSSTQGCDSIVTIDLRFSQVLDFEKSFVKRIGEELLLDIDEFLAQINSTVTNLEWSPSIGLSCADCIQPEFIGAQDEIFTVTITDENGCAHVGRVEVRVETLAQDNIYIPNAFTPNEDGRNDVFQVLSTNAASLIIEQMNIYNRYGGLIFSQGNNTTTVSEVFWDGRSGDREVQTGVYVYLIFYPLIFWRVAAV